MTLGPAAARTPTPGTPEREAVRLMFDRIAPRYDLLNHLLSLGIDFSWRHEAVAALPPGGRVLDLCTGTADLLIECLRKDPVRTGVGIDLSRGMLGLGQEKLQGSNVASRGALLGGDAESLAFRDGVFDAALVAFGIRNVEHLETALGEVFRVLRPGGLFVILEFSTPRGILGSGYRLYFNNVLPRLGGLVSGDSGAYAYLPASVGHFPEPPRFQGLLREAGFGDVTARALTFGTVHLYTGRRP